MHDWMAEAECRNSDPELFFPTSSAEVFKMRRALAVCASCPVQLECSMYRKRVDARVGVWHGQWFKQDDSEAREMAVELSESGLSLVEIAERMGAPRRRVSAWLAGEKSRRERLGLVIKEPETQIIPAPVVPVQMDRRGVGKVLNMLRRDK